MQLEANWAFNAGVLAVESYLRRWAQGDFTKLHHFCCRHNGLFDVQATFDAPHGAWLYLLIPQKMHLTSLFALKNYQPWSESNLGEKEQRASRLSLLPSEGDYRNNRSDISFRPTCHHLQPGIPMSKWISVLSKYLWFPNKSSRPINFPNQYSSFFILKMTVHSELIWQELTKNDDVVVAWLPNWKSQYAFHWFI